MNTKWNLLVVFVLLASLVGGTTSTAQAQEAHYFTWDPAEPQEGVGTVTFTATPPEGYLSLEWSRSTDPGGATCDLPIGGAGGTSVSTELLKSGLYQVCLKITYSDTTTYDDIQQVTVTNLPPTLGTPTVKPAITVAGYPVAASVPVTDYDSGLTCTVDFGDNTAPVAGILNGSCTAIHTYTDAGDYTVTFTVSELGVESVTAETTHTVVEPYATLALGTSGSVQSPEAALDGPDGVFATIRADSIIALGLGAPVEGAMLTVYHSTRSPSCTLAIDFSGSLQVVGATATGADHSVFSIPAQIGLQQYFAIQCSTLGKKAVFELDAIQVEPIPVPAGFAIWALSMDGSVQNPGAAVGAPDQIYATIPETGGMIVMAMDIPMQQGILTIYHSTDSPACPVLLGMETTVPIGTTLSGANSTRLVVGLPPGTQIPYFAIQCAAADKAVFKLDAVQFQLSLEPTGYAVAAGAYFSEYGYIGDAQDPGAATGEPDGQYATTSPQSSSPDIIPGIVVDMGDTIQGSMLTVYHSAQSASCAVYTFTDSGEPREMLGFTIVDAESSAFGISQDFRYVWIVCSTGEIFELDAVHFKATAEFNGHAISILSADASVKNPTAAVGAPDGSYATVPAVSGEIILDLGVPFSGLLTITHTSGNPTCTVLGVGNLSGGQPYLIGQMMSGMTYTILPISITDFPTGIRYVWIDCTPVQKGDLSLDAVKVEPAPTPTGNGLIVLAISGNVKNQDAALGEPDNAYATIGYPGGDIALYMGTLYASTLTVYHSTTSPSCNIWVGDAEGNVGAAGTTTAGATSTTVDLQGVNIMFAGVQCSGLAKKASFQLDAVQVIPPP